MLQSDSTQTIDHIQKCFRQKFQCSRRLPNWTTLFFYRWRCWSYVKVNSTFSNGTMYFFFDDVITGFKTNSATYFTNHPLLQKKNIAYNLIDRAILLSHESFHRTNLKKVEQLLINNDYPSNFIDKNIKIRMNKIKYHSSSNSNIRNNFFCPQK